MDSYELVELFYNRAYEKFVDKQILDDKNYIVPRQQLINYVHELVNIPLKNFIKYINAIDNKDERKIDVSEVTRFSSFPLCEIEMCKALIWANNPGCLYVDIGRFFPNEFFLKNDSAYKRYGESHVKAASQLGLTFEYYNYWYLSCLGYIYPDLEDDVRKRLLARTITRNRLYQIMLIDIFEHDVSPEVYINSYSEKVIKKRLSCIYVFFDFILDECKREEIKTYRLIKNFEFDRVSIPIELSNFGKNFQTYLREFNYLLISKEDTISLIIKYRNGDKEAFELLVKSNMKHVLLIAKMYINLGVEFDDLVQEGIIGLIRAFDHFNINYNIGFGKYAKWWIIQAMSQSITSLPYMIKFPANTIALHRKVWHFIERFEQHQGYLPSINDIDVEEKEIWEKVKFVYQLPSNLKELTLLGYDQILNEKAIDIIEEYDYYDYNKFLVQKLLASLSYREKDIIESIYGIDKNEETLESIGERMDLSRERVRQIHVKAIKRLKRKYLSTIEHHQDVKNDNQIENEKENKTQHQENKSNDNKKTTSPQEVDKELKNSDASRVIFQQKKKKKPVYQIINDGISHNYSINNEENRCVIYDSQGNKVYSSTGIIKIIGTSLFRVNYTYSFISVNRINVKIAGWFATGDRIIFATFRSPLYEVLDKNDYLNQITDIQYDVLSTRRIKVNDKWYDDNGDIFHKKKKENNVSPYGKRTHRDHPLKVNESGEIKHYIIKEALVGDRIIYDSKRCTVIKKTIINSSLRLIIRYDDGIIDNVPNDWDRYKVL